jgi:hypothetical protein
MVNCTGAPCHAAVSYGVLMSLGSRWRRGGASARFSPSFQFSAPRGTCSDDPIRRRNLEGERSCGRDSDHPAESCSQGTRAEAGMSIRGNRGAASAGKARSVAGRVRRKQEPRHGSATNRSMGAKLVRKRDACIGGRAEAIARIEARSRLDITRHFNPLIWAGAAALFALAMADVTFAAMTVLGLLHGKEALWHAGAVGMGGASVGLCVGLAGLGRIAHWVHRARSLASAGGGPS